MIHQPIRPAPKPPGAALVLEQLRLWQHERQHGRNPLPAMTRAASVTGLLATACDSFFQLLEACLGRPIAGQSEDTALIATLRAIPRLSTSGPHEAVPHGLPGALIWAGFAVLRELGGAGTLGDAAPLAADRCPYDAGARSVCA